MKTPENTGDGMIFRYEMVARAGQGGAFQLFHQAKRTSRIQASEF